MEKGKEKMEKCGTGGNYAEAKHFSPFPFPFSLFHPPEA
jgi:hypothetical protein